MSKNTQIAGNDPADANISPVGKSKDSFIQNPDQNNQIRREALGPNTKR